MNQNTIASARAHAMCELHSHRMLWLLIQVGMLAGALLVLGTVDGQQLQKLLNYADGGYRDSSVLSVSEQWPLAFGCAWALQERRAGRI